jgi:hypothetical protein
MAITNDTAVSTQLFASEQYIDFTITLPPLSNQTYQFCFAYAPIINDDHVESRRFIAAVG